MSTRQHTFSSRGPVRTETLLLGSWVATPFGRQFHTEEVEVLWVRQDEAQVDFFWDGRKFKEGSMLTDYYGPLTSIDGGIKRAGELVAGLKLTTTDRLEIQVTTRIYEVPARCRVTREWYEDPYLSLEHEQLFAGTPEELARVAAFVWDNNVDYTQEWSPANVGLGTRELAKAVVFSSRWTDAENAAAREAFEAPFREVQP